MIERMLTVNAAAAAAGVTRHTIYNWLKAGKVRHRRTAGGGIRIDAESLYQSPLIEARRSALPPFPIGPLLDPADRDRL